jgi:hypothetical protein
MPDNNLGDIDILGSWVEVGMVIAALTAGIFFAFPVIKHFIKKRKNNKCIWKELPTSPRFVKVHTKIHEQLTELRVVGDAARCQVMQFHNGGKFLDGSSIKRFSVTHESCRKGISETRQNRQDVMLTMFGEMLETITNNNPTPVLTSNLPDCHWKRHLELNNIIMFSLIPLRNANGMNIIGFLSLEWCSWMKADEVDSEDITIMIEEKRRYIEAELAIQNI